MNTLLKSISYIFHPLIMPITGVVFFFLKSPRYIPEPIVKAKLYALILLTIVLPLLLFFLLRSRGKVSTVFLPDVKERIFPLLLQSIIVLLITVRILPSYELVELHFFFVGILVSTISCLILALVKFKISLHMVAAGGVLMFVLAVGIHYSININRSLAAAFIITGAIASSRLHLNAHSGLELIFGFFVGLIPQLILLNYWL